MSLRSFLAPLGLESYVDKFEEEEITDVALLRSMGPEMLLYSMEELGMGPEHIDVLAKALFLDQLPESSGGKVGAAAAAVSDDDDMILLEQNENGAEADQPLSDDGDIALEENHGGDDDEPQLELEENGDSTAMLAEAPSSASATMAAVSDSTKRAAERVKAQGNAALKSGKYADAASFYGQAIALDPTSAIYRSNRAAAYASLGRYEEALADAKAAVSLEPGWVKAHLRVAGALSGLSRHVEARDAYAAALKCEPGNAHIEAMVATADEAASLEAQLNASSFDWVEEINHRNPPHEHYVRGVETEDDYPMVVTYKEAMKASLREVAEEEGSAPTLRTVPGGAAMRVETILSTTHWLQLVADVASEREARIGGETYPAVFVEHFPGTDLADWLPRDVPPAKATSSPRVKFVDAETLAEYTEGEDRRFTAEPLVYSPIGEYIRAWWEGTACKIGVRPGELCKDEAYLTILNGFGTLNWLLFKWKPEALHGDEILRLLLHGAPEPTPPPVDASLEAHWKDFTERAFVMLGPRRFDEIQDVTKGLQAGEISGADAAARSRYCMGREFELLHQEYLDLLEQLGYKLK